MQLQAYDSNSHLVIDMPVLDITSEGRALDWLRQRGPFAQLVCRIGSLDRTTDVEASPRALIEAPLTIVSAALALMAEQGSGGNLVLELDLDDSALGAGVTAFWHAWLGQRTPALTAGEPTVQIRAINVAAGAA